MHFYAQLDENNICIGVSQLSGDMDDARLIALDAFDADLLGQAYANGNWTAKEQG